jgi:hypothetical protein
MTSDTESLDMADCYGLGSDDLPDNAFPISYTLIDREQKKDKTLLKRAQTPLKEHKQVRTLLKSFMGAAPLFAYYVSKIKLSYRQI